MKGLHYLIGVVILACVLCGCRTTRIVEVPVVHTEFVRHDSIVRDSIHTIDSVTVVKLGDTIFNTNTKYIYRYKFIQLHDTLSVHDTLTVVREVEKRLTGTQQAFLSLGKVFFLLLITLTFFMIIWLIKR